MYCPNCGASNPKNAKFCNECGTNLMEALKDLESSTEDNQQHTESTQIDYKSSNIKSDLDEPENDIETEDPPIQCIICKNGYMTPTIHTGTFGIGTRKMLICDKCGAVFEMKGQKYKFTQISNTDQALWIRYGHQTLTETEWIRIREGGVSDVEQKKNDMEQLEIKNQETQRQREEDASNFLSGLQNGTIPIKYTGPSPVILKKDETISFIMENINLQEPRAVRQTHAAYGGPTIRVAKGVSFKLGGASARSESHDEIRPIDQGKLILTTKRLIFIGAKRTLNIDLRKIMAVEAYKDGIESQRENKQKPEYFTGTDKHTITFTINGRSGSTPVYGNVLKAAIQGTIAQL